MTTLLLAVGALVLAVIVIAVIDPPGSWRGIAPKL
jgi:hypothetical protein